MTEFLDKPLRQVKVTIVAYAPAGVSVEAAAQALFDHACTIDSPLIDHIDQAEIPRS